MLFIATAKDKGQALSEQPARREFTTRQAASWLTERGLPMSWRTVSRRVDAGEIAAWRTPGGQRRIRLRALEHYLRDHS